MGLEIGLPEWLKHPSQRSGGAYPWSTPRAPAFAETDEEAARLEAQMGMRQPAIANTDEEAARLESQMPGMQVPPSFGGPQVPSFMDPKLPGVFGASALAAKAPKLPQAAQVRPVRPAVPQQQTRNFEEAGPPAPAPVAPQGPQGAPQAPAPAGGTSTPPEQGNGPPASPTVSPDQPGSGLLGFLNNLGGSGGLTPPGYVPANMAPPSSQIDSMLRTFFRAGL